MGLRDRTISRHGSKCFYLLNYCFGPQNVGLKYSVVRKNDSKLVTLNNKIDVCSLRSSKPVHSKRHHKVEGNSLNHCLPCEQRFKILSI